LGHKPVEVGVGWALNVEGAAADVIDGLIVEQDSDIGVLKEGVGGEDTVVWLNHRGGDLRGRVHGEPELGLLAIVHRETLKEKGTETGARSSSNSVEHKEALETSAVVGKLPDAVKAQINNLLANCVVTTGKVVGCILLATDELLRVEELAVVTSPHLINH
ncbi:Os11g0247350, partial [Oryza sativa Japonica Group]